MNLAEFRAVTAHSRGDLLAERARIEIAQAEAKRKARRVRNDKLSAAACGAIIGAVLSAAMYTYFHGGF